MKKIFFFLFLCSIAQAKTGDACWPSMEADKLSTAALAWLRGDISTFDPELQAQKKIRLHSEEIWTERTFAKIFPFLEQVMVELGEPSITQVWNYFDRPARLARLVYKVGSQTDLLTPRQLKQLKDLADGGVPLKVEDWGAYDSVQHHLFGIAATLAEPAYHQQAMASAYLHKKFIPKSMLETYQKTGSLATWRSPDRSAPLLILFPHGTFHPILLTNPSLLSNIEVQLSFKNSTWGQEVATLITQYVFDNIQTAASNPGLMKVFSLVLTHHSSAAIEVKRFQFDSYMTALGLAQRLEMQSSR
jgi:hypothetical protein